jgi:hypothetical protein
MSYKIFDTVEKSYLPEVFNTYDDADYYRDDLLRKGMYPDKPYTVYEIREEKSDLFKDMCRIAYAGYVPQNQIEKMLNS